MPNLLGVVGLVVKVILRHRALHELGLLESDFNIALEEKDITGEELLDVKAVAVDGGNALILAAFYEI